MTLTLSRRKQYTNEQAKKETIYGIVRTCARELRTIL